MEYDNFKPIVPRSFSRAVILAAEFSSKYDNYNDKSGCAESEPFPYEDESRIPLPRQQRYSGEDYRIAQGNLPAQYSPFGKDQRVYVTSFGEGASGTVGWLAEIAFMGDNGFDGDSRSYMFHLRGHVTCRMYPADGSVFDMPVGETELQSLITMLSKLEKV